MYQIVIKDDISMFQNALKIDFSGWENFVAVSIVDSYQIG